ncbi:hypothetical protein ACOMHN_011725 [Nucella lapillus]
MNSSSSSISSYQDSTPPREAGVWFKRQLPVDPRSPTDDIARTPIIVDSASSELRGFDPRSPTCGIARTPIIVDSASSELRGFDPRSPTCGIARTPIIVDSELSELDPRSPTCGIDRTPLSVLMEHKFAGGSAVYKMEVEVESPSQPPAPEDSTDVDDLTPHIDAEETSPLLPNLEQQTVALSESTPVQSKATSLPKKLFSVPQPAVSAPTKQVPVSRSLGLVARDTNSPRKLVQTKQRRQVAKSMGGVENPVGVDKENLAH